MERDAFLEELSQAMASGAAELAMDEEPSQFGAVLETPDSDGQ